MSLQREIIGFLLVMIAGGMFYLGFGELSVNMANERVTPLTKDPSDLGLDYWIVTRVHLFGFFVSCLGAVGLIIRMRQLNLIE